VIIGAAAAGGYGWPGVWPDGFARGAAGHGQFRDVSAVTPGSSKAEIVRLSSGRASDSGRPRMKPIFVELSATWEGSASHAIEFHNGRVRARSEQRLRREPWQMLPF
jgi:hypothetical protein